MAYDETTAERVRSILAERLGVREQQMFGGLCFTLQGNMCCGIKGGELILRLGNAGASAALSEEHVRPMDLTGKVIRSMVFVEPAAFRSEEGLRGWVERAVAFAESLPPK